MGRSFRTSNKLRVTHTVSWVAKGPDTPRSLCSIFCPFLLCCLQVPCMLSFPCCIADSLPSQFVSLIFLFFQNPSIKPAWSYILPLSRVPYSFFSYQGLPVSLLALLSLFLIHYLYLSHCLRDELLSAPVFCTAIGRTLTPVLERVIGCQHQLFEL